MEAHAGPGSWQDLWPMERSLCRSRFSVRTCALLGDPHWSSLFLKDCTLWKGPILDQYLKNCSLWEGLMLEQFVKDCIPWERPRAGAGQECEEEEEDYELTATPFPFLLHHSGGGGRRVESKAEPRKKGEMEERCCEICSYFSLSYFDFDCKKINSSSPI